MIRPTLAPFSIVLFLLLAAPPGAAGADSLSVVPDTLRAPAEAPPVADSVVVDSVVVDSVAASPQLPLSRTDGSGAQPGGFSVSAMRDTVRFRVEVGGSSDYTNEIYYLDSLATPTLESRQRFDIPEARYAGVVLAGVEGTRAGRGTHYSLAQEVSFGDLLKRASLVGRWRQTLAPDWRLLIAPRAQYRRDRTLGRDFEEIQASGAARLRRSFADGAVAAEIGALGDWLSTSGSGAALLLDRWSTGATAALEQADFEGWDGRVDYTLRGRVFPDSSVRDHFEHETQARLRLGWGIGNVLAVEGSVVRRLTMNTAPSSQDNFWDESAGVEWTLAGADPVAWPTRIEAELVQFDVEDAVLYFDHRALRARSGVRLQPAAAWALEFGPSAEWLDAPRAPEESFVEFGGYSEFETITAGSLWSMTPSAGRRSYRDVATSATVDPFALGRSSYGFLQFDVLGDQQLPAGWRARVSGSARWELHEDSSENAGSLYFSLDVRRLF